MTGPALLYPETDRYTTYRKTNSGCFRVSPAAGRFGRNETTDLRSYLGPVRPALDGPVRGPERSEARIGRGREGALKRGPADHVGPVRPDGRCHFERRTRSEYSDRRADSSEDAEGRSARGASHDYAAGLEHAALLCCPALSALSLPLRSRKEQRDDG